MVPSTYRANDIALCWHLTADPAFPNGFEGKSPLDLSLAISPLPKREMSISNILELRLLFSHFGDRITNRRQIILKLLNKSDKEWRGEDDWLYIDIEDLINLFLKFYSLKLRLIVNLM